MCYYSIKLKKQWPPENLINEVKMEGFHLLSKELASNKDKHQQAGHNHHQQQIHQHQQQQQQQSSSEGDSWSISFLDSEDKLIVGAGRRRLLSILKTLRDRHLDLPGQPINYYTMKTLVLYECEKHPNDWEWDEQCLGERLNGCTLQLICCLQSRRCPAYFLPQVDLFRGKDPRSLDLAAKITWRLQRELLFNSRCLDDL